MNLEYSTSLTDGNGQALIKATSWRADLPNPPVFGRDPFKHTIKQLSDSVFDDLYDMNTQSGSQVYSSVFAKVSRLMDVSGMAFDTWVTPTMAVLSSTTTYVQRSCVFGFMHLSEISYRPMRSRIRVGVECKLGLITG